MRGRYYALGLLAFIALLNTIDQSILSVTSPAIQAELRLTDTQVGLLSAAFVVVFGIAALPLGYAVDRFARRTVLGLGVAAWSVCTLFTGSANGFARILAARTLLGVGEATSVPATVSLLADHFPMRHRGRAAALIQAASQAGFALGLVGGGIVASRLGWRAPFFLAAVPGLFLAALALRMPEPLRGAADGHGVAPHVARDASPAAFARLLRIRAFAAATVANALVLLATTGIGAFIAIYITRRFAVDLAQVGALIGLPLLLGSASGNALGGWLLERRLRRSRRAHLEIVIAATAVAALGLVVTFSAASPASFAVGFLLSTAAGNVAMPALLAIDQDVVIPSLRGSAAALQQTVGNILGRAFGVILIGAASDRLGDLHLALLVVPPAALVLAAAAASAGLRSMPHDLAAMRREWDARGWEGAARPARAADEVAS
ncbi:MAG: MFS transporter [Chloroflexota bacterium]|nr:MFS transporter [Chloroflexota bacterium]